MSEKSNRKETVVKKMLVWSFIGMLGCGMAIAQSGNDVNLEKEAVKKVVMDAYVDGIFIKADPAAVAKGWHPSCDIVVFNNGILSKIPAYNWVSRLERQPKPLDTKARAVFKTIEVSGYAAIAVLELLSGDMPVYTDMMSLYKFEDGWKIVTKIFYSYPRNN
jgi:hypothetical protein